MSLPRWLQFLGGIYTSVATSSFAPYLWEAWFEAAIDSSTWTVTDPGAGTAWTTSSVGATGHRYIYTAPALSQTCRLRSTRPTLVCPVNLSTNAVTKKAILEFEMQVGAGLDNINNATTFFGLGATDVSVRTSAEIIGWALTGDALQSITDTLAAETTNTGFGETLTNWNKLRIEITNGHAKFFLNEVQKADHTTNLSPYACYVHFYLATEAGGATLLDVGTVRAWMEDAVR